MSIDADAVADRPAVSEGPAADVPPLPDRAVLVHVGPHKTGTTSIQAALRRADERLAAQGVRYFGSRRERVEAAQAVRDAEERRGTKAIEPWTELVQAIHGESERRIVLSSEWFSEAGPAAIRRIVADLGPGRIHVVVTLRPLAAILPSQWQQYIQAGRTIAYDDWLTAMLDHPERGVTPSFWLRHRHDQLIARWVECVGRDRVTAIVVDDRDRARQLRVFEALLGLTPGLLELVDDRSNRSLTWPEIELVRAVNAELETVGIDGRRREDLVLFGAAVRLKGRLPGPDEPRVQTPGWALERLRTIVDDVVAGIASSGAHIVGDLDQLRVVPAAKGAANPEAGPWPEIAALVVSGILQRSGVLPRAEREGRRTVAPLHWVRTGQLVEALAGRGKRWLVRRLPRTGTQ
jgi:hypothetical protein